MNSAVAAFEQAFPHSYDIEAWMHGADGTSLLSLEDLDTAMQSVRKRITFVLSSVSRFSRYALESEIETVTTCVENALLLSNCAVYRILLEFAREVGDQLEAISRAPPPEVLISDHELQSHHHDYL